MNDTRLIEVAFPVKQASLDSVHEKNVRHGHISTLHIWPARRPLAACRAALIAALLPDPGDPEKRKQVLERMAGRVVEKIERKKIGGRTVEKMKEETVGGILHWGRENDADLDWFRREIRKAYGGRAPKVLDPFAGGGAIPLEAMRLGCEATAMDINPVAWFILKCTLDYPQKLAGQTRPLPAFALHDREFVGAFLKAGGFKGAGLRTTLERLGHGSGGEIQLDALPHDAPTFEADLSWHIRAWGRWVLARVRKDLASYYPIYAEFEALKSGRDFERRSMRLLDVDENGLPQLDPLNAGFDDAWLKDPLNPRWVAKQPVAYLWARTVRCKGCRATLPLLKTRWLCRKANKRVRLTVTPNAERTGVTFGVEIDVPRVGNNAAQRREHDKRIGAGTMSRSGARCPCCQAIMTTEDIRLEARAGRLGEEMTAVVANGVYGKEYRLPTEHERDLTRGAVGELESVYAKIPFGIPDEPISPDRPSPNTRGASGLPRYAIDEWHKLFLPRQLLSIGKIIISIRRIFSQENFIPGKDWRIAIASLLGCCVSRLVDRSSTVSTWENSSEFSGHAFTRFVLPFTWDFVEPNPLADSSGGFVQATDWVGRFVDHASRATKSAITPKVQIGSATNMDATEYDLILTDPPYYDAIPYSDLMDFFHVWLRRTLHDLGEDYAEAFLERLGPKWHHGSHDGELVDQPSRFENDVALSRIIYEDGMAAVFSECNSTLVANGRLILVFANKNPNAWETLVSALIRAGFLVDGSWPIQTERGARTNAITTASLASSVWLVCKKRHAVGLPGWDNTVLKEMREKIAQKLRDYWDAGIRGPDFVWAATGPALEAYSKFPVVKKANDPGQVLSVSEFLREVRRMVVDFVVGRALTDDGDENADAASGLDDVTTYYLLHRGDFGLDEAPAGACILYALSCNLSDRDLSDRFDLLSRPGRTLFDELDESEAGEEDDEAGSGAGGGGKVKLLPWTRRTAKWMGYEGHSGRTAPLIDRVHRLMHLWRAGEETKVNGYIDDNGLARHALFSRLLQALIELAAAGSEERAILESLSNHIAARGGIAAPRQGQLIQEATR